MLLFLFRVLAIAVDHGDDGLGQVELDAVKPEKLIELLDDAVADIFDEELYDELKDIEKEERETYVADMKEYVQSL